MVTPREIPAACALVNRLPGVLFGSDWPVCLLAGGYSEVLALARDTLAQVCAEKVFAANARHIYGLSEPSAVP